MLILSSDDRVRYLQLDAERMASTVRLSPEDERREALERERELRMHARLRGLAWIFMLSPLVSAFVVWMVGYAAFRYIIRTITPLPLP